MWELRQRPEWFGASQEASHRRGEGVSSRGLQRKGTSADSLSSDCSVHNGEGISFCYSKPPGLC